MVTLYHWLMGSLRKSWFLWSLIITNFFGSIYGFYWYKDQLAQTHPEWLRIFVPDSPTGSALFTLFLITLLIGRSVPTLEAFAAVTNFKYGVWAVAVILAGWAMGGTKHWTDFMLMFSHAGMAIESLLYAKHYTIRFRHILMVGIWTTWNDWMDYMLDIHPYLPSVLNEYDRFVGWLTFALSLFSLSLIYILVKKNRKVV
ncbi:DUF1405 domain-containing protein [Ammoniphilus sp. CFH 90114]|uniref:DUF1405 domain-containing protein n=1 Tax=Ammoniphilus sp. CFH 90114 TaxID=2493665 RepID=UPI00100F9D89|nr:DUF1405 domain-containing protein [Ammoniphilus sp. CFH 90114]RXT13933.1 DUF1405 domain-containing protein [Ammoniphilus sp. CFH 90114]